MKEIAKAQLEQVSSVEVPAFEELSELPTLYINNVEVSFTGFDMRLILGENLGLDDGTLRIKRRVKVFMSLEHAKVFARLLVGGIGQFEKTAGQEINFYNLSDATEETEEAKESK